MHDPGVWLNVRLQRPSVRVQVWSVHDCPSELTPMENNMRNQVSRVAVALALVSVGFVSTSVEARSFKFGGLNNGPIVI
jgi:hypothetical protein